MALGFSCVVGTRVFLMGVVACFCQGCFADQQYQEYREGDIPVIFPTSGDQFCFERKCTCMNDTADCSRNQGNLTFIPELPDSVTFLDFSYNKVHEIGDDFFLNVTNITGLDLSHNGLAVIRPEAFRPLEKLETLILNYNHKLTYTTLAPVFSVPGLKRLELVHLKLGAVPSDLFRKFLMDQLEILNLQGNGIGAGSVWAFDLSVFSALKSLRSLKLSDNEIASVKPALLESLEEMNLDSNGLFSFPPTCESGSAESFFPSLVNLTLMEVFGVPSIPNHVCLPKLKTLRVSLQEIHTHTFTMKRFPSLTELYISGGYSSTDKYAFMSERLELLSLSADGLGPINIHDDTFAGCPNLSTVVLRGQFFSQINDEQIHRVFASLHDLKHLVLESCCGITLDTTTVTVRTFAIFQKLTSLSLSDDHISDIADGAFDYLHNLTSLDLSDNFLSTVRAATFNEDTRHRLRHLDISGNDLTCSCDLMFLKEWIETAPSVFEDSRHNLTCGFTGSTRDISSFYMSDQACMLSQFAYISIIYVSAMAIAFITCMLAFCRCRRRIRPMLYDIFRGQGNAGREHIRREDYQFDVFVSYASDDLDWVRAHLMPELEERMRLRLCVHDRDFRPGKEIMANITDSLEVSRKVMLIFSTEFARSPWCQFELALCLRHVMDNADAMIVVYLHEIPPRELTNNMVAVMRTCTYLQWSNEPDARDLFWDRLRESLYDVIQDVRRQGP